MVMESAEIARRFTAFFAARDHVVAPSASLVADDPTLLFVNAGMAPLKPYFLGELPPPAPRLVTNQKVLRTVDIDEVGRTSRHNSFFQMLGNFSFGDYFKETAIPLAWELLTTGVNDGGFGFDPADLWVTVYLDDDEAADIWAGTVGLPAERIQRRGMADNFWSMGVPGPCGPNSEIYVDRGPAYGPAGGPIVDEERYLEVWNLVFMQYERGPGASKDDYPILRDLPAKNIDTGMGLERMAVLLQGVDNVYEIDTTRTILDYAARITGHRYGEHGRADVSLRVIADHVKSATMLIGDGVVPSNEAGGYVLRRMLRRAVRNLRLLGAHEPVMRDLVEVAVEVMEPTYPDLGEQAARIIAVAGAEEESFLATLRHGTTLFDAAVRETQAAGGSVLSGERAFALHDTSGFPIDLTLEMAAEQGLTVDEEGFRRLMEEQRARAKANAMTRRTGRTDVGAYRSLLADGGTQFTGYREVATEATVRGLLRDGAAVPSAGAGDSVEVVLDRTPFYAEAGGQVADTGRLVVDGAQVEVDDVQSPIPGLVVHRGRVVDGELATGAAVHALVEVDRRKAVSRAHTATHLVHRAIRGLLGETATQAGSLNAPGRLRFDFAASAAVEPKLLLDVEDEVNAILADDLPVRAFVTSQNEARRIGAMALFGEKYGDEVRVVEVGDYARELCGGTHALRSGQVGLVKLLGESSIGAGVRRIEALVGLDAVRFLAKEHILVSSLAESLKVPVDQLPDRIAGLTARLREAEKELEALRAAAVLAAAGQLAASPQDVVGVAVVTYAAPEGTGSDDLRRLALDVRGRLDAGRPGVVAVAAPSDGRVGVVVAVNEPARQWGLSAVELVRATGPLLGGGGGGRDDVAQGGGSRPELIDAALAELRDLIGRRVTGGG